MTLPPMKFTVEIESPNGYISKLTENELEEMIIRYVMDYGYRRPKVTVIENAEYVNEKFI